MDQPWENDPIVSKAAMPWERDPIVDTKKPSNGASDSSIIGALAGVGKGAGTVALNLQNYAGKGLSAIGAETPGSWLQNDATAGLKNLSDQIAPYKANSPIATGGGELAGEIAATLPVGGVLGKVVGTAAKALPVTSPVLTPLANSIASGGFRTGATQGTLQNVATRAVGGGITGTASGALVDPDSAGTAGIIGAALPGATTLAGAAGKALGSVAKSGISPDVSALAQRAKQLGIDIPADRIANNRPMNAVAAGLNYVPFSGRAATEDLMNSQLNQAVSNTFGQNSSNVTQALRKADDQLGMQFENVLKNNGVKFDNQMLNDVTNVYTTAEKELGSDALKPIANQIDELIDKGQSGTIDGQAAYNIKRTLDRLGRQNTPTAYHALELKGVLMDALDRSLGPQQAAQFATTRQQYGNMLALEKLAPNGVEGELSAARLANMRNINNPQLQEIADIAAQFVKPREGQHGAAQRAFAGIGATALGGPAAAAVGVGAGRATNSVLNSDTLKSLMLGQPLQQGPLGKALSNDQLRQLMYKSAPVISSQ